MRKDETHKLDAMEHKCLWKACLIIRIDRWRNEKVRRCVGVREKKSDMMNFQFYKLFEPVELTKKVFKYEWKENKGGARSGIRWLKKVCFARSLGLRDVITIHKIVT